MLTTQIIIILNRKENNFEQKYEIQIFNDYRFAHVIQHCNLYFVLLFHSYIYLKTTTHDSCNKSSKKNVFHHQHDSFKGRASSHCRWRPKATAFGDQLVLLPKFSSD